MPLLRKRSLIAVETEAAAGTAETLVAADGAFNAYEHDATPAIAFATRQGGGSADPLISQAGAHGGSLSFEVDLYTAAAWAADILPAAGLEAGSGSVYTKTSDTSAWSTCTVAKYMDGKVWQLFGCMFNLQFRFRPGQVTRVICTATGIINTSAWGDDASLLTPTYPTALSAAPRFASSTTTLGGGNFNKYSALDINLNNDVALLENDGTSTGYLRAWINPNGVTGTIDPEEELAATRDDFANWHTPVEQAFSLSYASVTLSMPKLQIIDIQPGERNGASVLNWTFQANRSSAAGDDSFVLTLA